MGAVNIIEGRKKHISILVIITLVLSVLIYLPATAEAWDASIKYGPTEANAGDTVTYSVEIKNTGSEPMKVVDVYVNFGWQEEDRVYYLLKDGEEIIDVGDDKTFRGSIPIPDDLSTNTHHSLEVTVRAHDPGFWGDWSINPSSSTYSGSLFVEEKEEYPDDPNDDNDDGIPGFTLLTLIFGVIITIAIYTIYEKKKQ